MHRSFNSITCCIEKKCRMYEADAPFVPHPQPDAMQKSQVVCSFYLTNSCTRGDNCSFSHAQPPRVICKHFISGLCKFGDLCRNGHDVGSEARTVSNASSCIFWKRGMCTKGDTCQFLHEPLVRPSDATSWRGSPPRLPASSVADRDTGPVRTSALCVYWKSGRCTKGAQCNFSHNILPEYDLSSAVQEREGLIPRTSFAKRLAGRPNDHVDHEREVKRQQAAPNQRDRETVHEDHRADDEPTQRTTIGTQKNISRSPASVQEGQTSSGVSHSEPAVERSFLDGVRALIGPGGIVQKVITAFDSCRVTLANIPDEASHQEIVTMADAFGRLKSVVLYPPASGTKRTAKLEYLDTDSAMVASRTLDGAELHTLRLAAQLDLRSAETGTADLRSSTLKMSWLAPARIAYAHYSSMFEANRKAYELNGKTFSGRKVTTVFQEPSLRQTINFTVILKNFPLLVPSEDLKKFCRTESLKLGQASYHGKEGITKVQELLKTFGPLESFDRSQSSPNDMKVKALVRFAKPEHAAAAAEKLQGQSQSFLGGAKIWVTLLHSIKYSIPKAQYRVLETDLRGLRTGDVQSAKVRVYDKDEQGRPVDPVCIRIYGDDPKLLGQLKTQMETLVSGEEVTHDGIALWDEFFLSHRGKIFAEEVQVGSGAFMRLDSRRRKVRLSGSVRQKDGARELLLRKISELRTQRHQLPLTRPQLGKLLQGELARLQGILGEDKISLDIQNKILIVRGEDEDIQAARLSLSAMQTVASSSAERSVQFNDCPVCFCEVTIPVTLACGHSYCFSCLRHYLASAENFPVKCLAEDGRCDFSIPLSIICCMLPAGEDNKFFDDAFLTYLRQHPKEYHFCPSPDCQQIYRPAEPGSILRCPSCLSRICPSCHVEFHEGLTCAEHKDNEAGGMSAYQKWKEENNVHSCPNCKVDIQKSMGCNHITCARCGSHICWVCLQTWPDGSKIYKHMNSVHGGIGL